MLARKLKSNRGMSIIMGLLLLLVCVTAGAAALTSAASNAGRYTHMRRDQQRYLAVASAARLVRDELCAGNYTASASLAETYTYVFHPNSSGEGGTWTRVGPDYDLKTLASSSYTGKFEPWLEDYMEDLFQAQEIPSDWWGLDGQSQPGVPAALECKDLSLQVGDTGDEPLLSQVKWTLGMGEDYAIYARFWLEETDKNGKVSTYYTTTLTIPANTATSETTTNNPTRLQTTTTQTLTVTWPSAGAVIRQS